MAAETPIIRPFAWTDLEALVELMRAVDGEVAEPLSRAVERTRRLMSGPGSHPERDTFLAEASGQLVGHVAVIAEVDTGRAIGSGGVHPDHRRRGAGRALLGHAMSHAAELGLGVFQLDLAEDAAPAIGLCVSEGLRHIRTHLHMRMAAPEHVEAPPPDGYALRPLAPEDVPALTGLQNAAFTGTWGYQPNDPEEIAYRIYEQPLDHPDDVVLLESSDGTLAGYCWGERGAPGEPGAIGMVGIAPTLQGRGLGRVVTAAGLNLLVENGARPIDITVDEANEPAVRLYLSLGFTVVRRSVWYEKEL